MRNNAAYLPESPIVYIILPKSIRNRASLSIFVQMCSISIGCGVDSITFGDNSIAFGVKSKAYGDRIQKEENP